MNSVPQSEVSILLEKTAQSLERGELVFAETLLFRILGSHPDEHNACNLLGFIRYKQNRLDEAAALLMRSLVADRCQPKTQLNLGHVLLAQGKRNDAIAAFRIATRLKADFIEAYLALANTLHGQGNFPEAEENYRFVMVHFPENVPAKLGLSAVLIETKRTTEAESLLRQALDESKSEKLIAVLEEKLGVALEMQHKPHDAFACYQRAQRAAPHLTRLEHRRAKLLQNLGRFNEAVDLFYQLLTHEPLNYEAHMELNDLLHCLGRKDEFLCSYDRAASQAPHSKKLLLDKAAFLNKAERFESSYDLCAQVFSCDPENVEARLGMAQALASMKKFQDALQVIENLVSRQPKQARLYGSAAAVLVQMRDPQRAVVMAQTGLMFSPNDQLCLALLDTACRMMVDERESSLNDYANLVRIFELQPPAGYSDMEKFNHDLNSYLSNLEPLMLEFIGQSLRGGIQTQTNIFGTGHDLVDRLRVQIDEAMNSYIADMKPDDNHPFFARRKETFKYLGAWSSRLCDGGYHVNHIHPGGWISSCYYVAVPDVVRDQHSREGWLKFGEPSFDVGLANPISRAIQPRPGQLVLFPSYFWHGTIPFRSTGQRRTIAFDAVPSGA